MVNSPLRWLTVTFSFPGNSAICIPNRARSSFCAPSKTALNCLDPCSPNTLALISVRRITCREYSLASARRTSFFTITSRLLGALVPSSSSSSLSSSSSSSSSASSSASGLAGVEFASACVFCVCRRRREEEGTAGEETASSGSCFVYVSLVFGLYWFGLNRRASMGGTYGATFANERHFVFCFLFFSLALEYWLQ